jgi:hypothetical protein
VHHARTARRACLDRPRQGPAVPADRPPEGTARQGGQDGYFDYKDKLGLLTANIVSGGGIDFMRVFAEKVYGVLCWPWPLQGRCLTVDRNGDKWILFARHPSRLL